MEIVNLKLSEIHPYEKNARKNDKAVEAVAESIRQCTYVAPIIVDENHTIIAGHTRWKALKKLGRDSAECIIRNDLSEEQKRKYRLLDNKTGEIAEWDFDMLADELERLDFGEFDFGFSLEQEQSDFDEAGLDEECIKQNVIISINCKNFSDYEKIKDEVQKVANKVNATLAVKMA